MQIRNSPRRPLAYFLVALAVAACADALGSGQPTPGALRATQAALIIPEGDTTPPDSSPPPPPPDTSGRAMIRGVVTGIDSTVVPPKIGPVPRTIVTLFAIIRTPPDSTASGHAPPTLDSIAVAVTDRSGHFFFSGLAQRMYGLRAIAPARAGFPPAGTRARAVIADDSTRVPITNLILHKNP
ncbi:MAG: hypothetical protein ABI877_01605 [Gemmatimonadaceae bacterium]